MATYFGHFPGAKRCVSQQLCPRLAWRKYTKGQASKVKKGVSNNYYYVLIWIRYFTQWFYPV